MEVDHRRGKSTDDLRFDWSNLFPSCRQCNGRRQRSYPEFLDPGQGVEQRLVQRLDAEREPRFEAVSPADLPAANTANELARIHDKKVQGRDLREALWKQLTLILEHLHDHERAAHDSERRRVLERQIRDLASRRAPFTALVRGALSARLPVEWLD
jgi:hypothetical protein